LGIGNWKLIALSYQFLPNILFILAVLGIILIILRKLPKIGGEERPGLEQSIDEKFEAKGLGEPSVSKLKYLLILWWKKFFNFVLEAKDLKPSAKAGYQIKKIFRKRTAKLEESQARRESLNPEKTKAPEEQKEKDENYYLAQIKKDPKKLESYDELGKYYLAQKNHTEGKDIYLYLTGHEPGNSGYHAKLALCFYTLKNNEQAIRHYETSLSLDSTQPNRYYNLGLCLEAAGKTDEAALAYEKAVNLEPTNPKYTQALSSTLSKLGKTKKTQEILGEPQLKNPKKKKKIV